MLMTQLRFRIEKNTMAVFTGNLFLRCNKNNGSFRVFHERTIPKHHLCWASSLVYLDYLSPHICLSGR